MTWKDVIKAKCIGHRRSNKRGRKDCDKKANPKTKTGMCDECLDADMDYVQSHEPRGSPY